MPRDLLVESMEFGTHYSSVESREYLDSEALSPRGTPGTERGDRRAGAGKHIGGGSKCR